MITRRVIVSNELAGLIVWTPDAVLLVIANTIRFVSATGLLFAEMIAARNEPGPLLLVLTTVKVLVVAWLVALASAKINRASQPPSERTIFMIRFSLQFQPKICRVSRATGTSGNGRRKFQEKVKCFVNRKTLHRGKDLTRNWTDPSGRLRQQDSSIELCRRGVRTIEMHIAAEVGEHDGIAPGS